MTLGRFGRGMGAPVLWGIVFFFVLCLGSADSIRGITMAAAVAALIVVASRFGVLRDRICLPFIALTLFVIMDGVSTFYAVSGKFALREFLKVFLAFLLAVILLCASPKEEEVRGKRIATILAVCTAIGSLVSIDLISTRWLSGVAAWVLGSFTEAYQNQDGIVPGTRISSFFDNSNVFAGVSGIGILLSLGLANHAEDRKERSWFLCFLYLNFLAFLLCFSMGAIVFTGLALLVLLLMTGDEKRSGLLFLMVELLIPTAASLALISRTSFESWSGVQMIPLLCAVVGAGVLYALDRWVGQKAAARWSINRKLILILIGAILVAAALFAVAALSLTGDVTLSKDETLMRTVYPKPGTYALDVQTDGGALDVRIRSRSLRGSMMNKDVILYQGDAAAAEFTVPEDSIVVYFDFTAQETVHVQSAAFNGHKIPLRYLLLPDFVAYRLQGQLASHSITQRLVYFEDGLKLFRRSPIIGLGMGAFENGIKSVQSFYYETKYAHNHYFQCLLEVGVLGLLLFLLLLVTSAVAIWKSRKEQRYAAMLGALWVFMAGQAVHDIVFSAYAYLPLAFGCFILINFCCGPAIGKPQLTKTVKTVCICVVCAGTVVYCIFLAGNMLAKRQIKKDPTVQSLTQCVKLDRFEWADYALPYVTNATGDNVNIHVRQQADIYAERLAEVNSNTIPIYLAEYYFRSDRNEQGIAMLEKYVDYVASDSSAWQNAFDQLRSYDDGSELFRSAAVHLAEKMEAWNAENMGTITLNQETMAYIADCKS